MGRIVNQCVFGVHETLTVLCLDIDLFVGVGVWVCVCVCKSALSLKLFINVCLLLVRNSVMKIVCRCLYGDVCESK